VEPPHAVGKPAADLLREHRRVRLGLAPRLLGEANSSGNGAGLYAYDPDADR